MHTYLMHVACDSCFLNCFLPPDVSSGFLEQSRFNSPACSTRCEDTFSQRHQFAKKTTHSCIANLPDLLPTSSPTCNCHRQPVSSNLSLHLHHATIGAFTLEKTERKVWQISFEKCDQKCHFSISFDFHFCTWCPGAPTAKLGKTENWQFRNYGASCDMRMSHPHVRSLPTTPTFPSTSLTLPCSLAAPLLTQTGSAGLTVTHSYA